MGERHKQHHGRSMDGSETRDQPRRDPYRDNDDVRDPLPSEDRMETRPDSRNEARGDARENIGNHSRNTDEGATGPEFNDKQRRPDEPESPPGL